MNTGSVLLGVFATLTVVFAVVSVIEYDQAINPVVQTRGTTQTVFQTQRLTAYQTLNQTVFQTQSQTSFVTTVFQTITKVTRSPFYFAATNVTIPLNDILYNQTFYMGSSASLYYTFNATTIQPPPCCPRYTTCTCTFTPFTLVFEVTQKVAPLDTGKISTARIEFTWWGYNFPSQPNFPTPSNATLFGGDVKLRWFTSLSEPFLAYLNVWVNTTAPIGTTS